MTKYDSYIQDTKEGKEPIYTKMFSTTIYIACNIETLI